MANAKKSTLTTPESQDDVTYLTVLHCTVDFSTGTVTGVYQKCTAADCVVGTGRFEYTMPSGNLTTVENEVLTQADAAGELPAGTVSNI